MAIVCLPAPLPASMPAVTIREPGGPEVLAWSDHPRPEPGPGQVLIEVRASGINRPDIQQRKGLYAPPPDASGLPGLEVGGRLVAGDAEALAARGLALGDEVCALCHGGGYAAYVAVDAGHVLPRPAGLSVLESASLPETLFTVWVNVFERAGLQAGESLLVHGGASGIGVAAIQMAKALGSTVYVTVGSEAKAAACRALGADAAILHTREDFVAAVAALTGGRGVDVVLDMVAGDCLDRNLRSLAEDGRVSIIAFQGGRESRIDVARLQRRRLSITGSTLRPRSSAFKAGVAAALRARVWPLIEAGRIRPVVHRVFPAREAAAAHALMESNTHIGKILLDWGAA